MSKFEEKMTQLRARFIERTIEDRQNLVAAAERQDRESLLRVAHGLAGTAGVFGFPEVGASAAALEEALDARADDGEIRKLCDAVADRLDEAAQLR